MPLRRKRTFSNSSESISAGNILNGVLDCKWNRTSATPSLLEIANTSEVKFNISQMTPLVLRFADGWDDIDQPKGVVKKITTPPPNINLSDKANCHVQIVARVINDELVITTHDIFDPNVGYTERINPTFPNAGPINGWSMSASSVDSSNYPAWKGNARLSGGYDRWEKASWDNPGYLYITAPFVTTIASCSVESTRGYPEQLMAKNLTTNQWVDISSSVTPNGSPRWITLPITSFVETSQFRLKVTAPGSTAGCRCIDLYEYPTSKFFRSMNKVKDRSDTEVYWINLGYAMMDASGNITALYHYTDLRNNYPGGMRVEP